MEKATAGLHEHGTSVVIAEPGEQLVQEGDRRSCRGVKKVNK
jgi:hypothetical protein